MFDWLKRMFSPPQARSELQVESQYIVTVDEKEVRCRRPCGETESVVWDDLDCVIVETNDTGPWGMDIWWLLLEVNGASCCCIPQGATGDQALLRKLQALPGFNTEQFIAAMSCADNQRFLCWTRPAAS